MSLKSVEGNLIRIGGFDVLDGMPMLDIKPYTQQFDIRENVRSGWVDEQNLENRPKDCFTPEGETII